MPLTLKEQLDYVSKKHHNAIVIETDPLEQLLNISYFSYQKITASGDYSVICNNPEFADFYLEKKFYALDPYLVAPSRYSEGKHIHFISPKLPDLDEGLAKIFKGVHRKFYFSESILIIHKSYDFYEIYCFSFRNSNKPLMPFYLNQIGLLERFITNFKKHHRTLLENINDATVNIAEIRGEDFNLLQPNYHVMDHDIVDSFLEAYSPEELRLKGRLKNLTHREEECLYWMIEGKTAAETGKILGISKRTVEVYRDKCRDKLGSHYSFTNLCYLIGKFDLF